MTPGLKDRRRSHTTSNTDLLSDKVYFKEIYLEEQDLEPKEVGSTPATPSTFRKQDFVMSTEKVDVPVFNDYVLTNPVVSMELEDKEEWEEKMTTL